MDTISRQAAIDAVKDAIIKAEWEYAENAIKQLPSAQPEIIRCKNCKHYEADIMANPWGVCCHDGWVDGHIGHEVSENGWCYRAERRTDG